MTALFVGSFICTIDAKGALILPDAFCVTITSRQANHELYIGLHDDAHCLVAYDRVTLHERLARFERGRMADMAEAPSDGSAGLRRHFGFAAGTKLDGKGHVAIAPWLNERRAQAHRALVIGMGHSFEIRDLDHVLGDADADLRRLAQLHLDHEHATANGGHHEPALPSVRPRRRIGIDEQPGLRVQPVYPLPPRHDPIGQRQRC